MKIGVSPIKFVHWDYAEIDISGPAHSKIQMLSGALQDGDTDQKKGLYIRWVLRVYLENKLTLSCIGEQSFGLDLSMLTEELLGKIIKMSQGDFKEALSYRIKETNITVGFQVDPSPEEISRIVRELRQ